MMLQQRKHAWIDRKKKKTKSDIGPGKCGTSCGKALSSYPARNIYKPPTYRQHEASKMSCSNLTSHQITFRAIPNCSRACKRNDLSQSQFLPPILALTADSSFHSQPRLMYAEIAGKGPAGLGGWKPEITAKDLERENQRCTSQKDVSPTRSAPGCGTIQPILAVPNCWEQRTLIFKENEDFSKIQAKKTQSSDLYKSCLVVISSRKDGKKEPNNLHQAAETLRSTVKASRTQCSFSQSKLFRSQGISAWRSTEEVHDGVKAEDKLSSGDSAFGTDTCSETAEVDIELGLEVCNMEMNHYTHQRIINWIMDVNAVLFCPHTTELIKSQLTEQDTSIKIVYEGD